MKETVETSKRKLAFDIEGNKRNNYWRRKQEMLDYRSSGEKWKETRAKKSGQDYLTKRDKEVMILVMKDLEREVIALRKKEKEEKSSSNQRWDR